MVGVIDKGTWGNGVSDKNKNLSVKIREIDRDLNAAINLSRLTKA